MKDKELIYIGIFLAGLLVGYICSNIDTIYDTMSNDPITIRLIEED